AIDRVNVEVNYLYDPLHAGVLRLIAGVIDAGARRGVSVSMCGEMAGDPRMTRLLLGLGLREFSVHPAVLLELKRIINGTDISAVAARARALLEVLDFTEVADAVEAINNGSEVPSLT
ncbi:MAG: phosphoenolpyruvate--protein phosphotransferase, partial [Gammaproteobacteria bacterium]|nr:phosphoenolpyruvate--protein phosphotransferase [Gammaproteobacteria bacterium]